MLVLFFPRRLSLCLCYLPAHSFAVITLVSYSGLLVSPLSALRLRPALVFCGDCWVFPLASAERFFSLLGSAVLMCVGEIFTGLGAITTGVFFFYLKKL